MSIITWGYGPLSDLILTYGYGTAASYEHTAGVIVTFSGGLLDDFEYSGGIA